MEMKYNVTGAERKRLVKAISDYLDMPSKYMGMPSAAFFIGSCTVDKEGTLTFDESVSANETEMLVEHLLEQGFELEGTNGGAESIDGIVISMPRSLFTDTSIENLKLLLAAKGTLIKKALGIDALPVEVNESKVDFPWFSAWPAPEELRAYEHFICALCDLAKNQKRVTAKEKETDNEKYAFRCFLLRLGFIGTEYKEQRKTLLRNLSGSGAFKSGAKSEVSTDE